MSGPLLKSLHSTIQLKHLKAGIRKYMSEQFQYWFLINPPPQASGPPLILGDQVGWCHSAFQKLPQDVLTITVFSADHQCHWHS